MAKKLKTLHLIDGNNWMSRAFFAAPKLTNSKGFPVGAIKAMSGMLMAKYRSELDNTDRPLIVVVFDGSRTDTWRSKAVRVWLEENEGFIHEGYKGTRTSEPDLREQIPHMVKACKLAGFPVYQGSTYEADDIIGTLALRFSKFCKVEIHSSDKDFAQCIGQRVKLMRPNMAIDESNVVEVFNVLPNAIQDYLAMIGDGVDNIPGIPGIGPGTAVKLLEEYGSLDAVIANVPKIKGNSRWLKALKGQYPLMDLELQRSLVQIDTNVPKLPRTLDELYSCRANDKALLKLKKQLELSSLLHV